VNWSSSTYTSSRTSSAKNSACVALLGAVCTAISSAIVFPRLHDGSTAPHVVPQIEPVWFIGHPTTSTPMDFVVAVGLSVFVYKVSSHDGSLPFIRLKKWGRSQPTKTMSRLTWQFGKITICDCRTQKRCSWLVASPPSNAHFRGLSGRRIRRQSRSGGPIYSHSIAPHVDQKVTAQKPNILGIAFLSGTR